MWDLIVSVPDHCLSFYFETVNNVQILKVAVLKEIKQGLAWQYQFLCKNCTFASDLYTLDKNGAVTLDCSA